MFEVQINVSPILVFFLVVNAEEELYLNEEFLGVYSIHIATIVEDILKGIL